MKKKYIIISSIIAGVLAILLILFGAVFVLRKQSVVFIDDANQALNISENDIINTAGLKKGKSIFMLDKDKATANIESTYPYLKVVQIKTTSAVRVEIKVRRRFEMYYSYVEKFKKYYVFDEDLKLLRITEIEPTNLTYLNLSNLGITANTLEGNFVGDEYSQKIIYDLFTSIYKTVKIDGNFLTREQICSLVTDIEFKSGYTLDEEYTRVILTTSYGVKIDIGKPEDNFEYKINFCFATLNALNEEQKSKGTIKFFYLGDGTEIKGYSAE